MNMKKTKPTSTSLLEKVNSELKEKKLQLSDSDMFIYCSWYTGNHWIALAESKKKVA